MRLETHGLLLSEYGKLAGRNRRDFVRLYDALLDEPDLLLCDEHGCPFCTWARKRIRTRWKKSPHIIYNHGLSEEEIRRHYQSGR